MIKNALTDFFCQAFSFSVVSFRDVFIRNFWQISITDIKIAVMADS